MNLVDVPQVLTQILGFLLMVWILRRYAWGPVIGMLEARREKIAGEFKEGERLKAEAVALKARYDALVADGFGALISVPDESIKDPMTLTAWDRLQRCVTAFVNARPAEQDGNRHFEPDER